ncbi:UDP-N-acetylmuramoyl-L-alanine--D-glutamate ligase [Planctobacterium marinum]|uniref:UDP-N-acetylmuramoylalanine--D-glutamate ligase n=1 Tax=Planctobacterium marinum TaxID=1631968 RepID=A0AA48HW03_9ALTE|nr:UDP-N-acetylmuramoylalanine--D-glutamate ligase [Planctobacterium marinum]
MLVSQLKNKKIAIVGMGLTGQSCARFLVRHDIDAVGFDSRSLNEADFDIRCQFGAFQENQFIDFDVILLSPGISLLTPAIRRAIECGVEISSDIALFAANFSGAIIGVTGSNGKSTVVSMLEAVFLEAQVPVALGGNIGIPALDILDQDIAIAVLELSSFQLETVSNLPLKAAAVLNVCEDHMDRYPDFQSYCAAKQSIFDNAEFKLANIDDKNTWPVNAKADAYIRRDNQANGFGLQFSPAAITFDGEPFIFANELKITGIHNLLNAQATCIIASQFDVPQSEIRNALCGFEGLAHRCQLIAYKQGISWVNDSKATNVGATIAAIEGLRPLVDGELCLIAGGDAKQADLSVLANRIERDVNRLITLGKDGHILAAMKDNSVAVQTLQEAVKVAANEGKGGDMVLLSPACASLDMFDNYQHRGQVFVDAVEELL